MSASPLARYNARVEAGEASHDDAQAAIAARLENLANELKDWRPANGGWKLSNLFAAKRPPPNGVYIHGKVGRGKTMLMDLFFDTVDFAPKRRIHFHEFMAETHDRIGEARKKFTGDPLPHVASAIADGAQHGYRRRNDPRPAVQGAVRTPGRHGRDVEPAPERPLP
jgi:cell division protein ZapE